MEADTSWSSLFSPPPEPGQPPWKTGASWVSLAHGDAVLYRIEYKMVAVFLVLLVCVVGIVGNAMVVLVVLTMRDMPTPTNCYLVSLALADLTVLVAAGLPNVSDSLAGQWVYGHAGCLGITYLQYLGINASSCSILAFTVERYIAICHPMRAQTVCTVARAERIIAAVWGVTSVYCLAWFFLVDLSVSEGRGLECGYKVSRSLYLPIYLLDFAVFFVTPLLAATVLYGLIGRMLLRSSLPHPPHRGGSNTWRGAGTAERQPRGPGGGTGGSCPASRGFPSSRKQVTKMLVVVVLLFAVLWLPYRTLVLLNSFVARPVLDPWVLLFCRTCVYANSAINPVVYSLMSRKFRAAFWRLCRCGAEERQRPSAHLTSTSHSVVRETPQTTQPGRGEAAGPPPPQQEPCFSAV
ncbi:thyrotropin-releasing hormone receptor-like [Equus przewalskii]|uniref:Thyrotropin-releasing hormone receptor n=1 Tax=Equus przewalskii TaxID=9798 RepID=A0ABM2EB23_EQUPR|nr:thyrotropin-releasing hormone receptor-like [Equus caballus]